jgi:hypothetical protein
MQRRYGHLATCLIVMLVMLSAAACGAPRIDTSSDEKMTASMERVRASLPPDRRARFDGAIAIVGMSNIDLASAMADAMAGKTPSAERMLGDTKAALNGKTADEIIAAADTIMAQRKAKERAEAIKEIEELIKERDAAKLAAAELAKFEILRARFSQRKDYLGMKQPQIELRVRNGTAKAISHAYFVGTLSSPGREVPWLKKDFNYSISGGIEPGEETTWQISPNSFSAWGVVDAPNDAGLQVTVTQLDGPDGKPLFSTQLFTEQDAARLASLQKEYGQ